MKKPKPHTKKEEAIIFESPLLLSKILSLAVYIYINNIQVQSFWDCTHVDVVIDEKHAEMKVTHFFHLHHEQTEWGWEEKFSVDVVCNSLPLDVIKWGHEMFTKSKKRSAKWNGKSIYKLLQSSGIKSGEFKCIRFEEFSRKRGCMLYFIVSDE